MTIKSDLDIRKVNSIMENKSISKINKEGLDDFLVSIKRDLPTDTDNLSDVEVQPIKDNLNKQGQFVDYISKIIVPKYSNGIRFVYPTML